ncbi:hypothetical protein CKO36_05935, partial [Rhabdochromatium marinum]|nr:hypothetical protein [Rhabdochromatium marinum]
MHDRRRRAERLVAVAEAEQSGQSQREAALSAGVARSTLRHWTGRQAIKAPAGLARFVETPEGVVWLSRVESAAHWCIGERAGAGIRVIVEFLELSGLSAFIAQQFPLTSVASGCDGPDPPLKINRHANTSRQRSAVVRPACSHP